MYICVYTAGSVRNVTVQNRCVVESGRSPGIYTGAAGVNSLGSGQSPRESLEGRVLFNT